MSAPEPEEPLTQPMSLPTFWSTDIPRSYIIRTDDRAHPIDYMEGVARTLRVEPIPMDAGHFPMLSRPRATAELIAGSIESESRSPE
jgi:hypothetical protein